ncbi:hypothetical protein [Pseudanabaena sp. UWO310]|nr:hypothetical protein [Pseudanabaena sp. UWO310]
MGLIKYTTLKPAAIAARSPQVLDLDFNCAEVLTRTVKERVPPPLSP